MARRFALVASITLAAISLAVLIEPAAAAGLAQSSDAEFIDDAGRIIGSPHAGPDPEHPGDRGGYAQLMTFGIMVGGISFIVWRVTRQIRQNAAG